MAAPDSDFARWLLGSMRSGLVAVDEQGAIRLWNAEAERILGGPAGHTALGRPCREVLRHAPALVRLLLDALRGQQPPGRAEMTVPGRGGAAERTLGFTLATIRDDTGRVRGAAILFRDLTPLERRQEQDRLQDRLAALGQMAAGLAHEMRNPLAGMEMLAGLLHRRLVHQPEERELVEDLVRELGRLTRSVEQSLEFVRPENPQRSETDVVKLVDEALEQARSRVGFTGDIERRVDGEIPLVQVDRGSLLRVLAGLIENAFEAMAVPKPVASPRLVLSLHAVPAEAPPDAEPPEPGAIPTELAHLQITIEDNGPGVPEELRERIFYPFFTTKPKGSGVGLALAQKTVLSHGGHLEIEKAEGGGACFSLRLPLDASQGNGTVS